MELLVLLALLTVGQGVWVSRNYLPRWRRAASIVYDESYPKATVYYMDSIPKSAEKIIACVSEAMKEIQKYSCVKFIDAKNRKAPEGLGMLIFTQNMDRNTCNSKQGLKRSQSTLLTFGSKCGVKLKNCLREILHALGFQYEHERPDRDKYIRTNSSMTGKVDLQSVLPIESENDFLSLTDYDISSVMHFDQKEFYAKNVDVESRDYILQDSIGSQIRGDKNLLSHRDKQALNTLFQCSGSCRETLHCLHGGYMNKDCQCECPDGFTGRFCESLSMSQHFNVFCGTVDNSTEGSIMSPKYPSRYPRGILCQWLIKGTKEYEKIEFRFENIDLEHENMIPSERCKDTLRVWPHGTEIDTKSLSCLPEDIIRYTDQTHKTQKNWLLVEFRSDKWGQYNHSGFKINYRIIDDRPLKDRVAKQVEESAALKKLREQMENVTRLNCYACESKAECNRSWEYIAQVSCKRMQPCSETVNEHGEIEWRGCMEVEKCVQRDLNCVSEDSDLSCSSCCTRDLCNNAAFGIVNLSVLLICVLLCGRSWFCA